MSRSASRGGRVAVVGAGAFGAFTALALQARGVRVTLIDARGPGNPWSSSGGETRVFRAIYGRDRLHGELAARALELWRGHEASWGRRLLVPTGALWMIGDSGDFVRGALPILRDLGLPYRELAASEAARTYPQIDFGGIRWALLEERAGYLLARRACRAAVEAFTARGGEYLQTRAEPGRIRRRRLADLRLGDGSRLRADAYLFACGAWLPGLFPDLLGHLLRPTRQEVFTFTVPAGGEAFTDRALPVWLEVRDEPFYGVPGDGRRGFKVAGDRRGPAFDPIGDDRAPSPHGLAAARRLLARRFPALRDAPLQAALVCPYTNTPDHRFLLDRHPEAENLWLTGGGSGHGFKFAPAWGERAAEALLERRELHPAFTLGRFAERTGHRLTDFRQGWRRGPAPGRGDLR